MGCCAEHRDLFRLCALAFCGAEGADPAFGVPHWQGKRRSRFPFPPGEVKAPSPLQWQGPSPLPQRHAGIRTSRGPKPPASARPAPGGRFAPAGSGACLCFSRTCWSTGQCPARAGGNAGRVSCSRPERRRHPHRFNGRGHRPCHSATLILDQPGATGPGQRPPRPWRLLRPRRAGLWPFVVPGPTGLQGTVVRGRGKRAAIPDPAYTDESTVTASMAGAIAPAAAPRCPLSSRGPKPPASARPALGGRFAPAGSGAGLWCSRTCRSTGHRPTRAGETRCVS
jgi:hypothetical protein